MIISYHIIYKKERYYSRQFEEKEINILNSELNLALI